DRAASNGPGRGGAHGAARGAIPRSGVGGERGGSAARAGTRVRRSRRTRDLGMARDMSPARHRVSARADRHAVPAGPSAARVAFGGGGSLVHEPTALAVILDNSPSSGVVIDGRPVLERLKATARASLARATAADRLWLVLADGVARAGTREALLATVDSVRV